MEVVFLLNSLFAGLIPLAILAHFLLELNRNSLKKRDFTLILIALIYTIFSMILFLWMNGSDFKKADFFTILSTVLIIQTISLLTILYQSTKNKKVFYALIPFPILIVLIYFAPEFIHLLIPTSLLITLVSFLIIADTHEKSIPSLIIYSSLSLLIYLIFLINETLIPLFNLGALALFLYFILIFTKHLREKPEFLLIQQTKINSPIITLLKNFVFLIIMTNFIFIGTISIHELGHLGMAKFTNCDETRIVYELGGFPHTEVNCIDKSSKSLWIIAGIILPLIIALFLALSGGPQIKELSLQIIGFNLVISYLDLIEVGLTKILSIFSSAIGVSLIFLSLVLLARSRTKPLIQI